METLTAAIDGLMGRGFTENLSVVEDWVHVAGACASFLPTDLVIRAYRRFEGVPDPSVPS